MKKAVSAATSAALLASLLATAVAPSAFAAITVGSAGNVPVGGTSANNVSFTFTEQAIASIATNTAGSFTVTILDNAGLNTLSFSGTPSTVGSTGSLGATASLFGPNVLLVKIAGSDTANIESILVTGLKIKASSTAALGAIGATFAPVSGSITSAGQFSAGGTASGQLSVNYPIGTTSIAVNVTTGPGCPFVASATSGAGLVFATNPQSPTPNITSATALPAAPALQVQTLVLATATTVVHNAGEVVTEATACGAVTSMASPGTVVAAIDYESLGNATVFPGENNSRADNLTITEPSAGFLAAASTFTFKILTAGVVFSTAPSIAGTAPDNTTGTYIGGAVLTAPVISADRLSATVTVTTASTTASTFTLSNILYDVAATVPAGTFIDVGLTTSAGSAIIPAADETNAVVFRGIAASAPSPTVYIGENNQTAGLITFKESQAGFFTAGVGTGTNVFSICPTGVTYTFTTAPVAMVVGGVAAGNIILRDGAAASTTNIVTGIQNGSCYTWYVWTASTTISTIVIGAAPSAATGPLINVTVAQAPGGVDTNLFVGSTAVDATLFATVQFATAVYRNQVAVTALSQPVIQPGSAHVAAGNLQIAETGLGQLKAGEAICVEVLWRSFVNQDTFLNSLNTADLPVVVASGTGLVIGPVNSSQRSCEGDINIDIPAAYMQSFSFPVLQQSTAGDGKLVISNINFTTLADAPSGPVLLSVWGLGGAPTSVIFHSTVSDARIGVAPTLSIAANSALGLNPTSGYTNKTPKYQAKGKYVTWKFTGGHSLAGQRVNVLWAKKVGGAWGGPVYLKSAWADANGIVTFSMKSAAAAGVNIRVQWPGNISFAVSTSKALGAYWK